MCVHVCVYRSKGLLRSSYHESTKPLTEALPWNVAASPPPHPASFCSVTASQTTVPVNREGSLVSSLLGSVRWSHYRGQNSTPCQKCWFLSAVFFFVYLFLKCENPERPPIFQSSKSFFLSYNLTTLLMAAKWKKKKKKSDRVRHQSQRIKMERKTFFFFFTCQMLLANLFFPPIFSLLAQDDWSYYLLSRSGLAPFS